MEMRRHWCDKIRLLKPKTYGLHFNDELVPAPKRRDVLRRTFDTWGAEAQSNISRLHVGVVGLGSVGCLVAEAIAPLGHCARYLGRSGPDRRTQPRSPAVRHHPRHW